MTSDRPFIPGLDLARGLFEAVTPLLRERFPGLRFSAALIGPGSDVLGFDTPRSTDHDWGPRLTLFLSATDLTAHGTDIDDLLSRRLPKTIAGWPTHFQPSTDPNDPVGFLTETSGPVNHGVALAEPATWWRAQLGRDLAETPSVDDWLAIPQQRLAEATGGAVFEDGLGVLNDRRARLRWYPDQVWRYVLACQWRRIAQEEAFVGRCAEVDDRLGGDVVTARVVRDVMRLALLMSRGWAPYSKWLGSAFARLPCAPRLTPPLRTALAATDHAEREAALCEAYRFVAEWHNELGLTEVVDPGTRPFHSRPFQVLDADRFVRALRATLTDPELAERKPTGAVDQWVDNTDQLT